MLSLVTLFVGCGLLDMFEAAEQEPVRVVEDVVPTEPTLEMPDQAPMDGADIASGGLKEPPRDPLNPDAPEAAVPPEAWNPISVPQGPREGGVRWEGVKNNPRGGDTLEEMGLTEEDLMKNPELRPVRLNVPED